jgi:hypothetical protein
MMFPHFAIFALKKKEKTSFSVNERMISRARQKRRDVSPVLQGAGDDGRSAPGAGEGECRRAT